MTHYTIAEMEQYSREILEEIIQLRKYVHALQDFIAYCEANQTQLTLKERMSLIQEEERISKGISKLQDEMNQMDYDRVSKKLKRTQNE